MTLGLLFAVGIDSEEDVLAIRSTFISYLQTGKFTKDFNGEGTSYSKVFALPPDYVIAECNYFLKQSNPAKYGYRVTRTRPYFY